MRTILLACCVWCASVAAYGADEWTQDAHDAQRTGHTSEEPKGKWAFAWSWNGPDARGGISGHEYDAPREARVVTGGRAVYVPAGRRGLYALDKATGKPLWNVKATAFDATPAYDPERRELFAGGFDGKLYRIDAESGRVLATYDAGKRLAKSVLLAEGAVFVVDDSGVLHRVDPESMTAAWKYAADSPVATPPAYSAEKQTIVFATEDLHVHAVASADGARRWRVKPTPNPAGFPNTFAGGWPVIADRAGVVFVRLRIDHDAGLWGGPGKKSMYPDACAETRAFLNEKPALKNLFALRLDDGAEAFVPAVGYGGVEDLVNGKPYLNAPPVPVVRPTDEGDVAYTYFRSGQSQPPDGRWDSHLGEMVLKANHLAGLEPGDLRFVAFPNSTTRITDEQVPLTMAGDVIFRSHWGAMESVRVTDRSADRGRSFADPIRATAFPPVIRRQSKNSDFDPVTHWTKTGLTLFKDGRYWQGPGWWVYWNELDPPTPERDAYSDGIRPRYAFYSDGLIVVEGNGGELFVLRTNAE